MSEIIENLIILFLVAIPALIIAFGAYYLIKTFLDNERKKQLSELKMKNSADLTPLRMQAYERLVLLMERLSPNSLILRVKQKGMNSEDLHNAMIREVISEYEHNITQQIYVSEGTWNYVKSAKESVLNLLSNAKQKIDPSSDAIELSRSVFNEFSRLSISPTSAAIQKLKKEAQENF